MLKIMTLSFVGSTPETAAELHKQIVEEIEPEAELETVETQLAELANEFYIYTAQKKEQTVYWR